MKPSIRSLLIFTVLGASHAARADATITLHYNERPPYLVPQPDGSASGLTGTPAADAFKKAKIAVSWQKTPTSRQLVVIQEGAGQDCAIGWFKNPEREKFAKFTKAIYQDKPMVAIANTKVNVKDGGKFEDALKQQSLLVKDKFSYGADLDAMIARVKPATTVTTGESAQMVQMVNAGRVDMMLASKEEAEYYVKSSGLADNAVKVLSFPDMPQGGKRYIMCSKAVSDEVMGRLNAAIPGD